MKRMQVTGNLGADAVVKENNGKHILEMNVYCNDSRNNSHIVQVTQFHSNPPNNAHLFKKGVSVSAYGENKVNAWNDSEGNARVTEVLYADRIHVENGPKES